MSTSPSSAIDTFKRAFDDVYASSFRKEIEWQRSRSVSDLGEQEFLREAAWVILNSGFREAVIRAKFDYISLCFLDWFSARDIVQAKGQCIASALLGFGHLGKITAIALVAENISETGFREFKKTILSDPITELMKLPHIGPVTVWHLAKNLGFDVAKPDRHLVRLAKSHGYDCVHAFCSMIAENVGESVAVVDLVLWRHLASGNLPSGVEPDAYCKGFNA